MSNTINTNYSSYSASYEPSKSTQTTGQAAEAAKDAGVVQDTYEKSTEGKTVYKPDMDKVNALKADFGRNVAAFEKMVSALFARQGKTADFAGGVQSILDRLQGAQSGPLRDYIQGLEVDAATRAQAAELVSEDGYWGVNQTSARILEFAKAISGGDPSKIGLLRDAVKKGFGEAESIWGGALPEVSQKTYDKVMEGFDNWEKEANTLTENA